MPAFRWFLSSRKCSKSTVLMKQVSRKMLHFFFFFNSWTIQVCSLTWSKTLAGAVGTLGFQFYFYNKQLTVETDHRNTSSQREVRTAGYKRLVYLDAERWMCLSGPYLLLSFQEWRTPSSSDSWFHLDFWWARRQTPVWIRAKAQVKGHTLRVSVAVSAATYKRVVFPPGFALLRQSAKSDARHCCSLTPSWGGKTHN